MPTFTTRKEAAERLAEHSSPEATEELSSWLKTRPQIFQQIAAQCPSTTLYRVKKDAPYVYSCEGSILAIHGYCERSAEGVLGVPSLIAVILSTPHPMVQTITKVYVDPQWVEPVTVDEAFVNEN